MEGSGGLTVERVFNYANSVSPPMNVTLIELELNCTAGCPDVFAAFIMQPSWFCDQREWFYRREVHVGGAVAPLDPRDHMHVCPAPRAAGCLDRYHATMRCQGSER